MALLLWPLQFLSPRFISSVTTGGNQYLPLGETCLLHLLFFSVYFTFANVIRLVVRFLAYLKSQVTHISNGRWTSRFSSTRALFQSSFFPSTILRHYHRSHCTWMVFISSPNVTALYSFQYSRICVFCFWIFCDGWKE